MKEHVIDLGGYGPPLPYERLRAEMTSAAGSQALTVVMQVLSWSRERAMAEAGTAACQGKPEAASLAAKAEGFREVVGDLHRLSGDMEVEWLADILGSVLI